MIKKTHQLCGLIILACAVFCSSAIAQQKALPADKDAGKTAASAEKRAGKPLPKGNAKAAETKQEAEKDAQAAVTVPLSIAGVRKKALIVADKSGAGKSLAEMLGRIIGQTCKVFEAAPPGAEFTIHVGRTDYVNGLGLDLDTLHPAGYYLVMPDASHLVLAGRFPMGTSYAVSDFLKRFCGYRWFMPGELGEIFPRREVIELPARIRLREEPSFITYNDMIGWAGSFGRARRLQVQATHNLANVFPPKQYAKEHPEYYAMIGAKRVDPLNPNINWQPCVSNPDLPPLALEYAREYFKKNPQSFGISLGVNDGGGDCECPECLKLREKYKNQYILFVNDVARRVRKEFPGKVVGFLTYGKAGVLPENIALETNVYIEVMFGGFMNNFAGLRKWADAGGRCFGGYFWLYGAGNSGYLVPRYYPHVIGNAWKKANKEFGFQGAWLERFGPVGLYEGLVHYVLNELAWNINADIDMLLDDYFTNMYAEARGPARQFFDRIEEIYGRKAEPLHFAADCHWSGADPLTQFDEYRLDDLPYLDAKLAEAQAAAKDEQASERIRLLRKIWGISRLQVEAYVLARELKDTKQVSDPAQLALVVDKAARCLETLDKIEQYPLSEEDGKKLLGGTKGDTKFIEFYGCARTRVVIEREADRLFSMGTALLEKEGGWPAAREFWIKRAAGSSNETLKALGLTQVYLREGPDVQKNLVPNPSVEPVEGERPAEIYSKEESQKLEWERLDNDLPGWYTYYFRSTVAKFHWDAGETHTGKRSVSIEQAQSAHCLLTSIPVTPGHRYKIGYWVKQKPGGRDGKCEIRWQHDKAWCAGASSVTVSFPKESEADWRHVEATFTVPPKADLCVLLFSGARGQKPGEFTWIDDISITRIYDSAYSFDVTKENRNQPPKTEGQPTAVP